MMRHALWVLQQQTELIEKNTDRPFHETWKDAPTHAKYLMAGMAIGQSAVISMTPYAAMFKATGYAEEYVWARTAPQWQIKRFEFGPGIKRFRAVGWSKSNRSMLKLGAAKIASRGIPYVGWALLAYDAYGVGKWAYGKIS